MRNVRDFKVTERVELYSNGAMINSSNPPRQSVRSERSDITKTTPDPDGVYRRVTGYSAFFALTSSQPGEASWRSTLPPFTQYSLKWTGGEVPSSVWRHGVSSVLKPQIPAWCLAQVRQQMDSQVRGRIDVSQLVGEAKESILSIANVLAAVADLLRAVRRRDFRPYLASTIASVRRNGRGKTAAQAYLAWIYGFKPLIEDSIRVIEHWNDALDKPIGAPLHASVIDSDFRVPDPYKGHWCEGKASRGVSSGAYAYVLDPSRLRFSQLGLFSPLSVAWELTTLSFVVDWFFHIGAFVRTWEGLTGIAVRGYWETQWVDNNFVKYEDRYLAIFAGAYTRPVLPMDIMQTRCRCKAMFRQTPPHLLPAPPYISLGVDSSRVLSILALLLARSKPVWEGDSAKTQLYSTFLRGKV